MPTRNVNLQPGYTLSVKPTTGTLTVTGASPALVTITCELVPTPPTPPVPPPSGALVFESTFEPEDYPLWVQENGYFENGNTKTHGSIPVPAAMGINSLRMKQNNLAVSGGDFPPGASDQAKRIISLAAGDYEVHLWRVAHDTGFHAFSVYDENSLILGSWNGTDGLNEDEWIETIHPFTLGLDGQVTLEFYYTAPAQITQATGVKVALLRIFKA